MLNYCLFFKLSLHLVWRYFVVDKILVNIGSTSGRAVNSVLPFFHIRVQSIHDSVFHYSLLNIKYFYCPLHVINFIHCVYLFFVAVQQRPSRRSQPHSEEQTPKRLHPTRPHQPHSRTTPRSHQHTFYAPHQVLNGAITYINMLGLP